MLVESLPDTPERAQKELELQIALGNALMATKGYAAAEVEQTYNRAWELCQQVYARETSQTFPILYGRWILYLTRGEHQTAYQLAQEFLHLAQQQQDPPIVVAHQCMGWCFCMGELVSARAHFEQIAGWLAWAIVMRGWALAKQGQGEAGIAQIRQGLAAVQAVGAEVARTYQLTLLVEAYQSVGQPEAGLSVLAEALVQVEKSEERFWEAEIYRLKGELFLKAEGGGLQDKESPEDCFLKAIEVARRQEGKSLELRAMVSLGRLWQRQGKKGEARSMIAEMYSWFREGFDTVDLRQAKAR
jgi:predicted ATPase